MARNDGSVPAGPRRPRRRRVRRSTARRQWSKRRGAEGREARAAGERPAGFVDAVLRELRLPGGSQDATRQYVRVEADYGDLYVVYGEAGMRHVFAVALAGESPAAFEAMFLDEVGSACGRGARRRRASPGRCTAATGGRSFRLRDPHPVPACGAGEGAGDPRRRGAPVRVDRPRDRPPEGPCAPSGPPSATTRSRSSSLPPCSAQRRADRQLRHGRVARGGCRQEGVDVDRLERLASAGVHVVGSDATQVFCQIHLPRCTADHAAAPSSASADANAAEAAGYRPCEHCPARRRWRRPPDGSPVPVPAAWPISPRRRRGLPILTIMSSMSTELPAARVLAAPHRQRGRQGDRRYDCPICGC